MLHKLIHPTTIAGEFRAAGFVFDLPEGQTPPGSHAQGQGGEVMFRPYAEPCEPHEVEEYEAHQATLKAEAEAAAAAAHEAEVDRAGNPGPKPAGQRVRLTAQAQVDGALREAGYEFFLPEGEKGPMISIRKSHDRIDVKDDATRLVGEVVDEPAYEVVTDA